jgi:hypothetical protein
MTSVAESSQNDIVITVEKDWFIRFMEGKHSISDRRRGYRSAFPRLGFEMSRDILTHASPGL